MQGDWVVDPDGSGDVAGGCCHLLLGGHFHVGGHPANRRDNRRTAGVPAAHGPQDVFEMPSVQEGKIRKNSGITTTSSMLNA